MPRPLRIAIALPGLHRVVRGAETALEQIAARLALLGHQVTVFGSGPSRPNQPYRYIKIPCVQREFFENWPKFPGLRSHYAWEEMTFSAGLLMRYRPADFDVSIGCSYPFVNWVLRRGDREFPKHVFITENGDWMVKSRDGEYRFFDCDGLVCTNPQYFARYAERYPSALIPNGVDPDVFSPGEADRAAYGLPESGRVALMVSALIPSKRVIEGVRAAAKIPGLFLAVAGDGECRREVDEEASRLLPGRYLRVTLPRKAMPGLYRCADVFLHMSRDEASANAYLEALATGLPIVTHDWEVTRWTLEDRGFLVDCADEQAVTEALSRAIEEKSSAIVSRRHELVQRRFGWSNIVETYSDFLTRLCDATSSASFPNAPVEKSTDVGVVVIGRNEGDRLVRCLESVKGRAIAVVYVDSGSEDQSVANAKRLGAEVVELDASEPFTAARARNAGVERLKEIEPDVDFVQFLDGDCELRPSWLARAQRELEADPKVAAVCGRRRERFPNRSIYNRLMDLEWNTPAGPAKSVGGDAMFRIEVFKSAGFDPSIMAGEEPQFCLRLRNSKWKILRADAEMTLHDAGIKRFGQWWRRQIRGGYGALEVNRRFKIGGERLFAKQTRSAMMWAAGWPVAIVVAALIGFTIRQPVGGFVAAAIVCLAMPLQMLRLSAKTFLRGSGPRTSLAHGVMTMLGKWAWFWGQIQYRLGHSRGRRSPLIEYKEPSPRSAEVAQ